MVLYFKSLKVFNVEYMLCIFQIVLAVYMDIYAFKDPDQQAYYDLRSEDPKLNAKANVDIVAVHD